MKNTIIVESPFQMLCAISFINQNLKNEINQIYFINDKVSKNIKMTKEIIKLLSFKSSLFNIIDIRNTFIFKRYMVFFRLLLIVRKNNGTLIVGDLNQSYLRFICNRFYGKKIAIDDGFGSIIAHDRIINGFNSTTEVIKNILSFGYYKSIYPKDIEFHTIYSNYLNGENTFKHNLILGIEKNKLIKIERKLFFIGQPLINDGIVEESIYLDYLCNAAMIFQEHELFYLPHRRESQEILEKIKEQNFSLINTKLIAELEFLTKQELPSVFLGFYSTALLNIKKVLNNKDISFYYKELDNKVLKRPIENLKKVYEIFETEGIKNFDIYDLPENKSFLNIN